MGLLSLSDLGRWPTSSPRAGKQRRYEMRPQEEEEEARGTG